MAIRFWAYVNGADVKLTLRVSHPVLRHYQCRATNEGWESDQDRWSLELGLFSGRDYVRRESVSDGADCDGRLSRHSVAICAASKLRDADFVSGDAIVRRDWSEQIRYPSWMQVESSQRDYQAEAAGY